MEEENKIPQTPEEDEPQIKEREDAFMLEEKKEDTPVAQETPMKKADDIDGEINLQNKVTDHNSFSPLNYVYDGFSNVDDDVERTRASYAARINKSKIATIISTCVMLLAFVAVMLVMFLNKEGKPWITWVVFAFALVLIIGSFVISSIFSKKDQRSIKEYLSAYEDIVNGYLIHGLDVQNAELCSDAKIDETSFIQAHLYRTISSIDSRSVLNGKRHGKEIQIAEVAAVVPPVSYQAANEVPTDYVNLDGTPFIPKAIDDTMTGTTELQSQDMTLVDLELADEANGTDKAKQKANDIAKAKKENDEALNRYGLFGYFFSYDFALTSEESFIIYFMGDRRYTMLPNYLTGYKAVKIPGLRGNIMCYLAKTEDAGKYFDSEAVELLNQITPDTTVQSAFVSVNSHGTKIGLNLSDDIMNVPFKTRQTPNALSSCKEATDQIFRFIDHVERVKMEGANATQEEL